MAQTLSQILVHLVFSTKNRKPWLKNEERLALHSYLGGIVEQQKGILLKAGSVSDHIHMLMVHPRTCSTSDLVLNIKTSSSKWLKKQDEAYTEFQWQNGYGIFSISPGHRKALEQYIENQEEHHRKVTFQDELRQILRKNGIAYDEKYLWD